MNDVVVRFGEADLTTCDREPIHIPGSIQPHGVLLVIDRQRQRVEQIAGESSSMLGVEWPRMLGASPDDFLEEDISAFVSAQLTSPALNIAPLMRLGVRSRFGRQPLDLTLQAAGNTAIIELEPARRLDARPVKIVAVKGRPKN